MAVVAACAASAAGYATSAPVLTPSSSCRATAYLTLDTGNMSQAETIAAILGRQRVRATFFVANERTPDGDFALDDRWAAFWRARVAEGHAFGNHTFDHVYFRGAGRNGGPPFAARPQFGAQGGRTLAWSAEDVCRELRHAGERFRTLSGRDLDPIWRAPGGRAPDGVMQAAAGCGWKHVGWADAGFLGDELPSDRYPNRLLLERALGSIRDGDILMAHLGIWSRSEVYAPTLEPLIAGLKARGFCFSTIPEHPRYRGSGN